MPACIYIAYMYIYIIAYVHTHPNGYDCRYPQWVPKNPQLWNGRPRISKHQPAWDARCCLASKNLTKYTGYQKLRKVFGIEIQIIFLFSPLVPSSCRVWKLAIAFCQDSACQITIFVLYVYDTPWVGEGFAMVRIISRFDQRSLQEGVHFLANSLLYCELPADWKGWGTLLYVCGQFSQSFRPMFFMASRAHNAVIFLYYGWLTQWRLEITWLWPQILCPALQLALLLFPPLHSRTVNLWVCVCVLYSINCFNLLSSYIHQGFWNSSSLCVQMSHSRLFTTFHQTTRFLLKKI